jgi:hypothetical protein
MTDAANQHMWMVVIKTAFSVQRQPSRQTKEMGTKCYTKGTRQYERKEDFGSPFATCVTGTGKQNGTAISSRGLPTHLLNLSSYSRIS